MDADVRLQEARHGTRMSWNLWPSTRPAAAGLVLPLGCLYTPFKACKDLHVFQSQPVPCRGRDCGAALNPVCEIDFRSKTWKCPFCQQQNPFPAQYTRNISATQLPTEMKPERLSIEYTLPGASSDPPVFVFVLDTALAEAELKRAKEALHESLAAMPQRALVGFITYGAVCFVHELASAFLRRAHAFGGCKEYSLKKVAEYLGLSTPGQSGATKSASASRYLLPVSECGFVLRSLLDDIPPDPWLRQLAEGKRVRRCTSTALSVAVGLLETTNAQTKARIVLLAGGPCTIGPGAIVGEESSDAIRSHLDVQRSTAEGRVSATARSCYTALASRAAAAGLVVDVFTCSQEQAGLHEMRACAEQTGGSLVMADSFGSQAFKVIFHKVFACDSAGCLQVAFHAQLEVFASRNLQCCGAIGGLRSLGKRGPCVAPSEVGVGGTSKWFLGSVDTSTTLAFYFDLTALPAGAPESKQSSLQFQMHYTHPSGQKRVRVTTLPLKHASPDGSDIVTGFDQETAAVLVARQAVLRCEREDPVIVLRWLDDQLSRTLAKFRELCKDRRQSFGLAQEVAGFPQLMHHLRDSRFLQTSDLSPDESAFYRTNLLRENVKTSLAMLQPAYQLSSTQWYVHILNHHKS